MKHNNNISRDDISSMSPLGKIFVVMDSMSDDIKKINGAMTNLSDINGICDKMTLIYNGMNALYNQDKKQIIKDKLQIIKDQLTQPNIIANINDNVIANINDVMDFVKKTNDDDALNKIRNSVVCIPEDVTVENLLEISKGITAIVDITKLQPKMEDLQSGSQTNHQGGLKYTTMFGSNKSVF